MPIRLMSIAVVLCICAAPAFAQSYAAEAPNVVVASAITADGAVEDSFRISRYPYPSPSPQNPQIEGDAQQSPDDEPGKAQRGSRSESIQLTDAQRNRSHIVRGIALQSDVTCYAIRSYLVVRDDPKSDATHRDGSTTCVPAARVRMFTTADQAR